MSDDVDDLNAALRRAMASLDDQVPSGYFDALPARTLARLEDPAIGEIYAREDSGLKDIRDLASETRARLARRTAQGSLPPDDAVAASSASWKAVALPEPAKLDPPGPGDELESARARSGIGGAPEAGRAAASDPVALASRRGPGGRRTALVAVAGLGVAAAASAVVLLTARDRAAGPEAIRGRSVVAASSSSPAGAPASAPSAARNAAAKEAPSGAADKAAPGASGDQLAPARPAPPSAAFGSAATANQIAEPEAPGKFAPGPKRPSQGKRPVSKQGAGQSPKPEVQGELGGSSSSEQAEGSGAPPPGGKPTSGAADQPSLDELLGSDGKPAKPTRSKLGRTSLSTDDIKRGMTVVAGKAQACFAGTQGLASLRLTVAPTGRVLKATVTGPFAGTAVGACVERAVRTATFSPWDGGPQSFGYSYLLSD